VNAALAIASHASSLHEHETAYAGKSSTIYQHTRFACEHLLCPYDLSNLQHRYTILQYLLHTPYVQS